MVFYRLRPGNTRKLDLDLDLVLKGEVDSIAWTFDMLLT